MRALALFSFVLMGLSIGVTSLYTHTETPPEIPGLSVVAMLLIVWLLASFIGKVGMLVTGEGSALVSGIALALLAVSLAAFATLAVHHALNGIIAPTQTVHVFELLIKILTLLVWAISDAVSFISDRN